MTDRDDVLIEGRKRLCYEYEEEFAALRALVELEKGRRVELEQACEHYRAAALSMKELLDASEHRMEMLGEEFAKAMDQLRAARRVRRVLEDQP